jgi:hypothetical protein
VLTDADRSAVRARCAEVLEANWREGTRADGVPYAYTCPAAGHYPWQWYWDSCFAAIARRDLNPAKSKRELTSLLNAADPDGFIGHTIFWATPLSGIRRLTYNVTGPDATMTASIQPPLLAWAWQLAVGDPAQEPRIGAHYDWLANNRDLEGDGLIWIVQPDESGLDASPQFDPIWGWRGGGEPGFVTLVARNRKLKYDLKRIAAAGGPVCCELVTNVLYSLGKTALGRPSITNALIERCYDERSGLFQPDARPKPKQHQPVTWASLAPLALPDLPDQIARRLIEEHLLDPKRFWFPAGTTTVAADEKTFQRGDKGFLGIHRYWRGPVWVNASWLLWLGLKRLGYTEEADELVTRIVTTINAQGLREYYDPVSGAGLGQSDFSWSSLVLELVRPDS